LANLPLLASLHASSAQTVLADAAEDIARRLREFTPATLCALFVHDQSRGDLVCPRVGRDGEPPQGPGLASAATSGWSPPTVAAS
jgi:hypothetical protein